jgi:bis(5'-nucleosidyl)-tetraphosphatase
MNDYAFGVIPVYKDDKRYKFLLVKCRSGHWSFPKGHPNTGESEVDAARRELEEETGINDVQLFPNVSFSENYVIVANGATVHKTVKFFLGRTNTLEASILDSDEISEIGWEYFDEAFVKITYPSHKQILLDVMKYLSENPL